MSDYPDDYQNLVLSYAHVRDGVESRAKVDLTQADRDFAAAHKLTDEQMVLVRKPFGDIIIYGEPSGPVTS